MHCLSRGIPRKRNPENLQDHRTTRKIVRFHQTSAVTPAFALVQSTRTGKPTTVQFLPCCCPVWRTLLGRLPQFPQYPFHRTLRANPPCQGDRLDISALRQSLNFNLIPSVPLSRLCFCFCLVLTCDFSIVFVFGLCHGHGHGHCFSPCLYLCY